MANYVLDTLSLSSDPISRLSGVNELCSTDSWIIERIGDYNDFVLVDDDDDTNAICAENPANGTIQSYILKETTHTIDGVDHYSMCLTYDQLSTQLLNDISARFGFNTMAYKEKWQYARANHSHDYSMVKCVPHVSYDDVVNAYAPNTRIMTYNISRGGYDRGDGTSHSVNIPGVVSTIKRGNPTIVCLQEVDNGCLSTGNIDFLAKIKAYMGPSWNSEFLSCFDLESGQHGLGIVYDSRTVSNVSLSSQELLEDDGNGHPIKMQICEFTDFVVANVCMGSTNLSTQCENINNYFFGADSEYREKTIFLAGYFGVSSTSNKIDKLRTKFDIISLANDTSFVMVNKDRLKHLHNIKRLTIDDVSTTGHRPVMASFFYNDDCTKLDEWIGSMDIWALSSWEEERQGKYSKYKVKHNDYVPTRYNIFYPHIVFPTYQRCQIGEVRLIARWNMPTASDSVQHGNPFADETGFLYDDQNNGYWAYPQGQTITCNAFEFQEICKLYGNDDKSGNDTSFTLPCLSNYLSLNPKQEIGNPMKLTQYEVGLPTHNHNFAAGFTNDKFKQYKFILTFLGRNQPGYSTGDTNYPHTGGKAANPVLKYLNRQSDFNFNGSTSTAIVQQNIALPRGVNGVEVEPTHMDMPILMFIGAK